LLRTKLHRPPITKEHVYREDLIEFLHSNRYKPFTLVSAPAGYGKSMLISSWLEKYKSKYAWISLSKDDNDFRSFLSCIDTSIKEILPDLLENFGKLLNAAELPSIRVISEMLINELDDIDEEFILVLDDYHLIHNKQINELVKQLLKYPPQNMHLVILTRRDPALNLCSLRAHSRMNEVRMADLSFTRREIAILFRHIKNESLSDETIEKLYEKTEGWVTGLRLVSLTFEDIDSILKSKDGDIHLITEFLIREVILKQPVTMQRHLYRTSILNRFSADLIDYIQQKGFNDDETKTTGQEFINWLLKTNLFVISLDDKYKWFRYHHLFQSSMQTELNNLESEEDIKNLHLTTSEWFENNNSLDEAIEHANAADNLLRVADIIETHGRSIMNEDKWYIVAKWLELLPDYIIDQRPELLLIQAWKHYYHMEITQLVNLLDKIDAKMNDDIWTHKLSGEVSCFRGFCTLFLNESAASYKFLKHALNKIPISDVEFRVETELLYGLVGQIEGDQDIVIKTIHEWLNEPRLHPLRETRLLLTLIFLYYISGNIKQAERYVDKHRSVALNNKLENGVAWSDYLLGIFKLQQGNMEKAITLMEKAATRKYFNYTLAAVDNLAALAVSYQIMGLVEKVAEILIKIKDFTTYLGQPFLLFARSCDTRILLMKGDIESAKLWLDEIQPNFSQVMIWWFELPIITRCRVLIAEGSVENLLVAEAELTKYRDLNLSHKNQLQLINVGILLSLTYMKQNKLDECKSKIKETIAIAEPGGFVMPFIEPGKEIIDCIKLLPDAILKSDFVKRIFHLHTLKSQNSLLKYEVQSKLDFVNKKRGIESLSFREIDVLRHLAQGLRNKEIADKLYITAHTVKKHLGNVFSKLNVQNRIQAVNKAIELGIIEKN
jgi:LuxR family maltose regulon positive regulatory protein